MSLALGPPVQEGKHGRCGVGRAARLLLLGAALASTPAFGASPRIVAGTLTAAYPQAGAMLIGNDPATASVWCSGVLIGCRTFLTAAHCVCDSTGSRCQGAGTPSPAGRLVYLQHAGFFRIARIRVHPDFRYPVGDVAVLTLAAPVTGIRPAALATIAPAPGETGTIVGFGRSSGTRNDYGLKRSGTITASSCTSGISNTTSVCWSYTGTGADTCHGDSGGPLFFGDPGAPVVAGVTSGGTSARCESGDLAYDANVAAYHGWIEATAGEALGPQACGDVPAVGEPGVVDDAVSGHFDASETTAVHAVDVPAGTHGLRFTLNGTDDGTADIDLLVKAGAPPTTSDYDCRAAGGSSFGACAFLAPAAGPWFALVRRMAGAGTYQLTTTRFGGPAPVCGNGLLDLGEECDGADDAACPDACSSSCACTQRCTPGGVTILSSRLGARVVVRARLYPSIDRSDTIDPRASDFRVMFTGGARPVEVDIPAGDPGWSPSRPGRGRYHWRNGGQWNVALSHSRTTHGWDLVVTGRDTTLADVVSPEALGLEVSIAGTCIGG